MIKKQAGLKVIESQDLVQVKLYNTIVFEKRQNAISLAHGGWVTQSTAKAINCALEAHNINARASRSKGEMFLLTGTGEKMKINSDLQCFVVGV